MTDTAREAEAREAIAVIVRRAINRHSRAETDLVMSFDIGYRQRETEAAVAEAVDQLLPMLTTPRVSDEQPVDAIPAGMKPVAWASPGQLQMMRDDPDDEGGAAYLPLRHTRAGNFTIPLYAAPTPIDDTAYTGLAPVAGGDEIERLRKALEPFAACCDQISDDESDEEWAKFRLLIGDYRRARAVLSCGDNQ